MPTRYPIIYIRGYAMTVSERNDTAADPFCGFNVGSTLYRATNAADRRAAKFVFESPIVRLATEYQYQHAYQNGYDIMDEDWKPPRDEHGKEIPGIPPASIIIYRYYDDGSAMLGSGESRNIESYAEGLNELLLRVRDRVAEYGLPDGSAAMSAEKFGYHLVAHSMGGLVARAFLQAPKPEYREMRERVKRFFTLATPHNGIDVLGINVPSWLTGEQKDTFNRERMASYLNLSDISPRYKGRVDLIPHSAMSADNIFCMVGTNRGDYEVGQGVVRAFVGNGSDGLVRIENASLWGVDDAGNMTRQVATAYAFRSHSGYFGIVNSEEAYQNLARFLFGDVRVDIYIDVEEVTLPEALEQHAEKVSALYQFELCAAPKGKRWFLTRRKSVEDSPAVRTHEQLTRKDDDTTKTVYLSSVFLSRRSRVDTTSNTLSYAMIVAVKVPDYEVDRKFWPDEHFEGTDLFTGTAIVRVSPPEPNSQGSWKATSGWLDGETKTDDIDVSNGKTDSITIDFKTTGKPSIAGKLRLEIRSWRDA